MIAVFGGMLLMPRVMAAVSGGGPLAGAAVAIAFILAFFGVLWLRARHQAGKGPAGERPASSASAPSESAPGGSAPSRSE